MSKSLHIAERSRLFLLMLGLLLLMAGGRAAQAQSCWANGGYSVPFGVVNTATNTDVTVSQAYTCQSGLLPIYVRLCFFIPSGDMPAPWNTVSPRYMQNYLGQYIAYNLYSNAARTQIIGPPPSGGSYPLYTWTVAVPGLYQTVSQNVNIYGRVPPVPVGTPSTNGFQAQMGSGSVLSYTWSYLSYPTSCLSGGAGGGSINVGSSGITATVSNACSIALSGATEHDFGAHNGLPAAVDATSSITITCPSNITWKLGLSDGANFSGGNRRMAGPFGQYIHYELYRDAGRTLRWGNDLAGGTNIVTGPSASAVTQDVRTVYGRVPAQATTAAGDYADTITVTLEY